MGSEKNENEKGKRQESGDIASNLHCQISRMPPPSKTRNANVHAVIYVIWYNSVRAWQENDIVQYNSEHDIYGMWHWQAVERSLTWERAVILTI